MRALDLCSFTSAEVGPSFYDRGFEFDHWPEHASGNAAHSSVQLLKLSGGLIYIQLTPLGGGLTQPIIAVLTATARSNGSMAFDVGDKLTFRVRFGETMEVLVNDVLTITTDISADGDWSARTGDTVYYGSFSTGTLHAFGTLSPLREVPSNAMMTEAFEFLTTEAGDLILWE